VPLNQRKVLSIVLQQCEETEQRCADYRSELIEVMAEVLRYEQEHRVSATNIQQKINAKLNSFAKWFADVKGDSVVPDGET